MEIMKSKSVIITLYFIFGVLNLSLAQSVLEGTWKSIKQIYILPDTTYTATGDEVANLVKIINQTHFATIFQSDSIQNSMFNGGKYVLTDDTYTENLEYFSDPNLIGKSFTFKSKIKDGIWTIEGPIQKEGEEPPAWKIHEEYKKVN